MWTYSQMVGYFVSSDSTGQDILELAFPESDSTARPLPGKYYFVNSQGSNLPNGVQLSQICILIVGNPYGQVYSIGGTLTDTATVYYNTANKMVVFFSNIGVTGGAKVSGTVIE